MEKCFDAPVIVLVRPQLAENIGMTARAMMNCGLGALRLVSPRDSALSPKALAAAAGADEILQAAKCYDTLSEAVGDMHYILATTARPRDMSKPVYNLAEAQNNLRRHIARQERCAILFGAERTGLENDELVLANALIEIPLSPRHKSLNLSQAVLLTGYEWFKQAREPLPTCRPAAPADKQMVERFLSYLEETLASRGYFRFPDKADRMHRNLRNIFTRPNMTPAEVKTLYGVVEDLTRPPQKKKEKT